MDDIGKLLRELRGRESLREASKRIGISHTYLDTVEKGHDKRSGKPVKPTPETLKLISEAYNYSYNKLMILAGYIDEQQTTNNINSEREAIMNKIASEFPDIDLMFNDIKSWTAEEFEELYDYIKFKESQKEQKGD